MRHNNESQLVEVVSFNPLLQNEDPYYKNLNRPPLDAYNYANNVNMTLSYGGCVSRLLPNTPGTVYNLYDIVVILDGETITSIASATALSRFGIVLTEADDSGYYIICTFCPNLVYPPAVSSAIVLFNEANVGGMLYLDNTTNPTPQNNYWLTTAPPDVPIILGKITGATSIFFCGTVRLFSFST